MAVWPTTLPECPLLSGRTLAPTENKLVTQMATGKPKIRILYTAVPNTHSIRLVLTKAQVSILKSFYQSTIEFTWIDPLTRAAATCRILSVPTYNPVGFELYSAEFPLEVTL